MRIGIGLQNKLLEAMSMRIPSIATPLANDALSAQVGKQILVGENSEQLANQVIALLDDQKLYQRIAENGHAFVKQNYSWKEATDKLNKIIHTKHSCSRIAS